MLESEKFAKWLPGSITESTDKRYRHRMLKESVNHRDDITALLKSIVQNAHEDARRHLRSLASNSLDPLGPGTTFDPAKGYPETLNIQTLKGYFGEIFAGILAEHFFPFEDDGWKVPAFLFRFHIVEFQHLELLRQTGGEAQKRPGRTGDDCLAFKRDQDGRIIRSLFCEAKCTPDHDSNMIAKAHEKLSDPNLRPVDLPRLIAILRDYPDREAVEWVEALRELWLSDIRKDYERYDLVSYLCGQSPKQKDSWITPTAPDKRYKARRKLEAVETHIQDVEGLIREVYARELEGND